VIFFGGQFSPFCEKKNSKKKICEKYPVVKTPQASEFTNSKKSPKEATAHNM
jgi:hypothetical protein